MSPDVPKATWLRVSTAIHTKRKVNPINLHRTQRKVTLDYCHGNTPRGFCWICQTFMVKLKSYLLSHGVFLLTTAPPLNSTQFFAAFPLRDSNVV